MAKDGTTAGFARGETVEVASGSVLGEPLRLREAETEAGTDERVVVESRYRVRDYNDDYDRKADAFTGDARNRYLIADKSYFARTGENLTIHSGTRTVTRQAQLFVNHKWHQKGNSAAWPGCSYHNWGVAADMVRVDEAGVVAAMGDGGWHRTYDDGGWHFECTSSRDHERATGQITALRAPTTGLAYQWGDQLANFYIKGRALQKRAQRHREEVQAHLEVRQALQAEIEQHERSLAELREVGEKHNRDVAIYNTEVSRALALRDEINGMDDGPDKAAKVSELSGLANWIREEKSRLDRRANWIRIRNERLETQREELQARIREFDAEEARLIREQETMDKTKGEVAAHEYRAHELLREIEKLLGEAS